MEIWKTTTVNDAYEVSNLGRVKSKDRTFTMLANGKYECIKFNKGKILKPRISQNRNKLSLSGVGYLAHRLVAMAFLPNPNNLPIINHKDGNPLNNSVDNLEWCDHSHNMQHAYDIGLKKARTGENSHKAKLRQSQVDEIKLLRRNGAKTIELAKIYNVNQRTISAICTGKIWK